MTALYGLSPENFRHVNVLQWAANARKFLPLDFRRTPEQQKYYLKLLSMTHHFIKLPPAEAEVRYHRAIQEAYKYLPNEGFTDSTILVIQVAGVVFLAIVAAVTSKL